VNIVGPNQGAVKAPTRGHPVRTQYDAMRWRYSFACEVEESSDPVIVLQVEQNGPVLSTQIASAKKQLDSLVVSDAGYQDLLSIPPEMRSLADEVRICMHEGLVQLKHENEALRLSSQVRALLTSPTQIHSGSDYPSVFCSLLQTLWPRQMEHPLALAVARSSI
jgi:hypothetical protein